LTWIANQLAGKATETALRRMFEREEWFLANRQFLPGEVAHRWSSIRDDLQLMLFGEITGNRSPEVMRSVAMHVRQDLAVAIGEIERQ
jgi:hypothetical protein